jgi:hypothetical protein
MQRQNENLRLESLEIQLSFQFLSQSPRGLYGRDYFAGLRVTKRDTATVLLTLTLFQTPTLTPNPDPNLNLLQVCF